MKGNGFEIIDPIFEEDPRGWAVTPSGDGVYNPIGEEVDCHFVVLKPYHVRGNHYHRHKTEYIYVIGGVVKVVFKTGDVDGYTETLDCRSKPKLIKVQPLTAHSLKNVGEDRSYLLCFNTRLSFWKATTETVEYILQEESQEISERIKFDELNLSVKKEDVAPDYKMETELLRIGGKQPSKKDPRDKLVWEWGTRIVIIENGKRGIFLGPDFSSSPESVLLLYNVVVEGEMSNRQLAYWEFRKE